MPVAKIFGGTKVIQVPGETVYVDVPGETVYVDVPGPTVEVPVYVDVPGPTVYVDNILAEFDLSGVPDVDLKTNGDYVIPVTGGSTSATTAILKVFKGQERRSYRNTKNQRRQARTNACHSNERTRFAVLVNTARFYVGH
jgi:hypothetical protein